MTEAPERRDSANDADADNRESNLVQNLDEAIAAKNELDISRDLDEMLDEFDTEQG